jgi:hypothetical protein
MKNVIFIFVFVLLSCKSNEVSIPDDVIPEKEFVEIMVQVQLMEAYCQNKYVRPDLYKDLLHNSVDSLLKTKNLTSEEFRESFNFYAMEPKLMFQVYEQVLEKINEMQVKVNAVETKPTP